jgi:hypothetical protein
MWTEKVGWREVDGELEVERLRERWKEIDGLRELERGGWRVERRGGEVDGEID